MNSRTLLTATVIAAAVVAVAALAVLYGMNGRDVHAGPPPALDRLEPTPDLPPVPELAFLDAEGATRTLADFRGQTVLLNLWATWCAPCIAELPDLARAQAALSPDGIAVVPVNTLERLEAEQLAAFLDEHDAGTLPVYIDRDHSVQRALEAFGLPLTVLIDADGREMARAFGPQEWDHPAALAYLRRLAE